MKIRKAAYGILTDNGNVLVCHSKAFGRTVINFPGGAIDPGETAEQALAREFLEEVGTLPEIISLLYTAEDRVFMAPDIPDTRMLGIYYAVRVDLNAISYTGNMDDVECIEWISIAGAPPEEMLDIDRFVFENLMNLLPI